MKKSKNLERLRIETVYNGYLNNKKVINKWSEKNIGNQISIKDRNSKVKDLFIKNNLDIKNAKILDLGCASGNFINSLLNIGIRKKNITGIDIRKNSIKNAKKRFPEIRFQLMDARKLEYSDNTFDCIIIFTLFSSVLKSLDRKKIAEEAKRVLKSTGFIIFYDVRMNNPFNKNIIGMNKKELSRIFYDMKFVCARITLIPPIARNLGIATSMLYPILCKLPFLNSHYICSLKVKD